MPNDRVWHNGLIYKIKQMGLPKWSIRIIQTYLTNRTFEVKIGEEISEEKEIKAGVPQGSVLGPLLFNVYMADIPAPTYCKLAQFVDDTAIYFHHRNSRTMTRRMQEDLDEICQFLKNWRIKINKDKTKAMLFNKRARRRQQKLQIDDQKIEWYQK